MTEQKKVSLTIETDWLTYDYVDRLSKTLETIHQSIGGIQQQTAQRFEELREWELADPTEWLEDIEEELAGLRKKMKEYKINETENFDEVKRTQTSLLEQAEAIATAVQQVKDEGINQITQLRQSAEKSLEHFQQQVNHTISSNQEAQQVWQAMEVKQTDLESRLGQIEKIQKEMAQEMLKMEARLQASIEKATASIIATIMKEEIVQPEEERSDGEK